MATKQSFNLERKKETGFNDEIASAQPIRYNLDVFFMRFAMTIKKMFRGFE
jgi:hypothetical protein